MAPRPLLSGEKWRFLVSGGFLLRNMTRLSLLHVGQINTQHIDQEGSNMRTMEGLMQNYILKPLPLHD